MYNVLNNGAIINRKSLTRLSHCFHSLLSQNVSTITRLSIAATTRAFPYDPLPPSCQYYANTQPLPDPLGQGCFSSPGESQLPSKEDGTVLMLAIQPPSCSSIAFPQEEGTGGPQSVGGQNAGIPREGRAILAHAPACHPGAFTPMDPLQAHYCTEGQGQYKCLTARTVFLAGHLGNTFF